MLVTILPCLHDNYAYLLRGPERDAAVVVDPGEAAPVLRACAKEGLELCAILATHHHWDHIGGVEDLLHRSPALRVYAHAVDQGRVPGLTHGLTDGSVVVEAGLELRALHVPGHTRGAIAYVGHGCAFTGDTLFAAGCGRLFEGTAAELYASLNHKLARLPPTTRVYCGHEYTAKNLDFALAVEPSNAAVEARRADVRGLRARGCPTVPTTIGAELATNPFLRTDSAEIRATLAPSLAADASGEAVFAALRAARNELR